MPGEALSLRAFYFLKPLLFLDDEGSVFLRYGFVASGLLALLASAYFDNIRGPLLPVVTDALGLDYGRTSWFFVLGSLTATITSLLTLRLMRHFDERILVLAFAVLGIGLIPLAFAVSGLTSFLIFGVVAACMISGFGGLANLLVLRGTDVQNRARYLCALHLMYGLGSLLGPLVARRLIMSGVSWQWIIIAGVPLLVVSIVATSFLPKTKPVRMAAHQATRLTKIDVAMLSVFAVYVGGEVMTSMWMVAYLKESAGMPVTEAAPYLTLFFLAMAVSRGMGFVKFSERGEFWVMTGSLCFSLLFSILGVRGFHWALPCVGIFGPFFPIFLARISRAFPERAKALTIWVMASINGALVLSHLCLGRLAARVGVVEAFQLSTVLLALTLAALAFYLHVEKKSRRPALRGEPAFRDALV